MTVKSQSTGNPLADGASVQFVHAGKELKRLLEENRRTPGDLADAIDRSRAQIYNYFKEARFRIDVYEAIAPVLRHWKIDPTSLSPVPTGTVTVDDPSELRALLNGIPIEALPNVRRIILADHPTKIALLALIEDRLDKSH